MIVTETKYYFSIKSMIFATLFIGGITTLVLSVSIKLIQESLIWSIAFATPLIVIIIALPDYLRFLYCAIIDRPALELTKELLINNTKGQIYKWIEIKEIVYKDFTGTERRQIKYTPIFYKVPVKSGKPLKNITGINRGFIFL